MGAFHSIPGSQATRRSFISGIVSLPLISLVSGCNSTGQIDTTDAHEARGPITVWFSNDQYELQWAEAIVEQWNSNHPDEQVTHQEVPAGSSAEEAITAAITAGSTPDLIFNIAVAPLTAWVQSGGLVNLSKFEGAKEYIAERTGSHRSKDFTSDGEFYVLPWKSNPVMVMYNKELFAKSGLDPDDPQMSTYDEFLAGSRQLVESGAAQSAIWPDPSNEFFQSWFDFYPLFLAQTGGTMLVQDGKPTFADSDGEAVAQFWSSIYRENLAPKESSVDDAMATGATAMQITGPWAVAAYRDSIDVGYMPVPTLTGKDPSEVVSFADSKNIAMCETCRHRGTAWDFMRFATSQQQDGAFLSTTGQMPMRDDLVQTYSDFFSENPAYEVFAKQADNTADVPPVPNSIEVWQRFRSTYSGSIIFDDGDISTAFAEVAEEITDLVNMGSHS